MKAFQPNLREKLQDRKLLFPTGNHCVNSLSFCLEGETKRRLVRQLYPLRCHTSGDWCVSYFYHCHHKHSTTQVLVAKTGMKAIDLQFEQWCVLQFVNITHRWQSQKDPKVWCCSTQMQPKWHQNRTFFVCWLVLHLISTKHRGNKVFTSAGASGPPPARRPTEHQFWLFLL